MLTDEDIMSIRNRAQLREDRQIDIIPFARQIERAVIDKVLAHQERLSREWTDLWGPIDASVRPITPLGESVAAKALELINAAKAIHSQPAIDLNANERGEPDAIYLKLHDPDDIDVTQASDYRGDGVTWCWERIHENDVRYVRADLAVKK